MSARIPLPDHLRTAPFAVHAGRDAGLGVKRMRGGDLARPYRGVRTTGVTSTVIDRCVAYQQRMPQHAFFCSVTAAVIMAVPLPRHLEQSRVLHVGVPSPHRAPAGRDVCGHSMHIQGRDTWLCRGIRMSAPERTWCELAALLALADLVVVGDFLIGRRHPLTTTAALAAALGDYPGRRGVPALRAALPLLNERSESPQESRLRVIVVCAKLTGLAVNFGITTTGGHRYRADLAFPRHKVIIEYQCDYHRQPEQFREDMTRISRVEADGWFVMQLNADDLRDPAELVQRIRLALASHPTSS